MCVCVSSCTNCVIGFAAETVADVYVLSDGEEKPWPDPVESVIDRTQIRDWV